MSGSDAVLKIASLILDTIKVQREYNRCSLLGVRVNLSCVVLSSC